MHHGAPEASAPPAEAAPAEAIREHRKLNLSLPKDYSASTEAVKYPAGGQGPLSPETTLSRGISAATVPDCLRPQAAQDGLGGLLALPGLAIAAAKGKCK
jgi:hypothetical protein